MIMANSYRYAHAELKQVYFGVVDYEEAPQIFQAMNLNTAPILYHFGPKLQGKKKPDQMDFQRHGFDADAMARFVADQTDVQIRILRPPNYAAPVVIVLLLALVLGLLYMKRNNLEFLYNRTSWGLVCLCITFVFLSGQMWNHIRGPPFIMNNPQTREASFIHGSTQYQLVAETYIVGALYAAITFGFILLNEAASPSVEVTEREEIVQLEAIFSESITISGYAVRFGWALSCAFLLAIAMHLPHKYKSDTRTALISVQLICNLC
ncbi:magnesium transporter protein 1 domain protein [Ostertagia ostertagi]